MCASCAGLLYKEVRKGARQNKERKIKRQLTKYISNLLSDTGLVATNFMMKSITGGTVALCNQSELELAKSVDKIEKMTYLTMKHHISMACYQDLSAHFPELPRKCKVQELLLICTIN